MEIDWTRLVEVTESVFLLVGIMTVLFLAVFAVRLGLAFRIRFELLSELRRVARSGAFKNGPRPKRVTMWLALGFGANYCCTLNQLEIIDEYIMEKYIRRHCIEG